MKRLFKITTTLGFANSLAFIGSLIKNKLIAIFLGTAGMGVISQLNSFLNLLSNLGTLGMQQGVAKFSSSCMLNGKKEKIGSENILSTALFLAGAISLVLLILAMSFNKTVSSWIFSDDSYGNGVIVAAFAAPFVAFAAIFNYYFKGVGNINLLFKSAVLSSAIGLAVSFLLILAWKVNGAVFQIFTTAFISFLVFYLFFHFLPGCKKVFNMPESGCFRPVAKELLRHGSVIYVSNLLLPLSLLIVRSMVIKNFGIEQNGIFQSIVLISAIVISFPSEALWAGYFPEISREKNQENQKRILMHFIDFLIFIAIPAIMFVVVFQKIIINLLFSSHFASAVLYLPVRLFGDFVYMLGWPVGLIFFANSLLGEVLFFSVLWNFLLVAFSVFFIKVFGFSGIFIAYVAACLIILILQLMFLGKRTGIVVGHKGLLRISLAIISAGLICLIAQNRLSFGLYLLPITIWFYLFLQKFKLGLQRLFYAGKQ